MTPRPIDVVGRLNVHGQPFAVAHCHMCFGHKPELGSKAAD